MTTTETTTTTAKKTRTPKAPKIATPYPFETKAQIAHKIATDSQYVMHALCQLHTWQTQHEQEKRTTEVRNRRGFMSSHAVTGSKLAEKLKGGEGLTPAEFDQAQGIVSRYTRQLAVESREQALLANPDLAATAKIFGV
jgi:hypothetical protein